MKKIGIDLRCLPADGSAGSGVAHAARAVTEEMVKMWDGEVVLYVPRGAILPDHHTVWIDDASRRSLKHGLMEHPCDLLFVPSGAVTPGLSVSAVPWVHDCDIFDHPEWFPQSWIKRQVTTRFFLHGIRNAPHVFAPSEYTKQAIERLVPSVRGRVTVTGEGGDGELAKMRDDTHASGVRPPEAKSRAVARVKSQGITRRFVLILGTLEPRKNIPLICQIWPEVAKALPEVDLVIAGQDGWKTGEIHEAIKKCQSALKPLDSKLILIQKTQDGGRREFTEDDRRDLLLAADIVLVPSFSEGFGLVALEAIQAGTPVIASNRGALPEVVGEGEWLLDPMDDIGWRGRMIGLLKDDAARQELCKQQSRQNMLFSWKKTARRIFDHLPR